MTVTLIMGDSNFDWCMVTSGTWESNNKLILKYEKEYEGGQWVVILQKTDDGYLFISNRNNAGGCYKNFF